MKYLCLLVPIAGIWLVIAAAAALVWAGIWLIMAFAFK